MKFRTCVLFLGCLACSFTRVFAQEPDRENPVFQAESPTDTEKLQGLAAAYPFIRQDLNRLEVFGQSLDLLFEKMWLLEAERDEEVKIFHMGDSHIQADIFSGYLRNRFKSDQKFPVTSRGFLFPYPLAQTNNPTNYRVTYEGSWVGKRCIRTKDYSQWGVAGVTAETFNPEASFTLYPNGAALNYPIRRVKVFYPTQDATMYEVVVPPTANNRVAGYLAGDGYVEFVFEQPQESVTVQLRKTQPSQSHFLLQGVSIENTGPGLEYSASGVNAAEVTSYLRCPDLEKNVAVLQPDLFIISLGTNDAYMYNFDVSQFKANMGLIIQKIRRASPNTAILLTAPADNFRRRRYPNKNNATAALAMRDLAAQYGIVFWDFYQIMGGLESINDWYASRLCQRDKLHFTTKGYEVQGELLYQAIQQAYERYKEAQGYGN